MTKKEMLTDLVQIFRLYQDEAREKASVYRGLKGYETGFHDGIYKAYSNMIRMLLDYEEQIKGRY